MRVLNFGVAERACFAFEYPLAISSIALLEVMHLLLQHLLFLLQGAGIYVDYGGEATLTNTNVFDNEAGAPMLHQRSSYFSVLCTLNLPTGSSSAALLER